MALSKTIFIIAVQCATVKMIRVFKPLSYSQLKANTTRKCCLADTAGLATTDK
jgi:hypothetical protein